MKKKRLGILGFSIMFASFGYYLCYTPNSSDKTLLEKGVLDKYEIWFANSKIHQFNPNSALVRSGHIYLVNIESKEVIKRGKIDDKELNIEVDSTSTHYEIFIKLNSKHPSQEDPWVLNKTIHHD